MKTTSLAAPAPHARLSMAGLLVALGIVFGDIGTSPLYVMKAIVRAGEATSPDYIIGAVSCIVWTLTLQTTLKYVVVALRADNKGEGGILALYALVRRQRKRWLYLLAIVGAGTLIADGVITPSITVVSAIEGLRSLVPATPVVPISIGIITALFFVQQFGTHAIGRFFGPLMLLWFTLLGVLGALHVPDHWAILKAFNPYYAFSLLLNSPEWFLVLGAVFLCTTGAEALYSDLGHCGINNIRVSWMFVKTMLLLNYLGQGAWLLSGKAPAGDFNPFFAMMPPTLLPIGIALATVAAIIASQALISGSFTIFSEAMNLNFWPRQQINYPTEVKGQLYIPFVNHSLYVLCVATILVFGSSERLEAAYGLSITLTMLMTTLLLGVFLRYKGVSRWVAVPFMGVFLTVEGLFLAANLSKFLHGGWFTLLIAGAVGMVMYVWYNARRIRNGKMQFVKLPPHYAVLADIKQDEKIQKCATNLVYMSKADRTDEVESKILYSILRKHPMRADHYWLLHVDYQDDPDTLEYSVETLIPDTLFKVNLRLGFRVHPYVNLYFRQIVEDLVASGRFSLNSGYPSLQRHGISGDFRFVIIHRVQTHQNSFTIKERLTMGLYDLLNGLEISVPQAFGLDTSNVMVERVPLVIRRPDVRRITPVADPPTTEEEGTEP